MSNIVDTILNVQVFVFIGVLIWLYFKPDYKNPAGEEIETEQAPK